MVADFPASHVDAETSYPTGLLENDADANSRIDAAKLPASAFGKPMTLMMTPGSCPAPVLPEFFYVNEDMVDFGWHFEVKANGKTGPEKFGDVSEDLLSFAKELKWKWNDKLVCEGTKAIISIGDSFDITDCEKQKLASLEEDIFDTIGSYVSRYTIKNAQGKTVGMSEKIEWIFTPKFSILSADGQRVLASITRPVFSWGDQWQIRRNPVGNNPDDQLAVDPRVLVMLASFKTAHGSSATKWVIWTVFICVPLACIAICCAYIFISNNANASGGSAFSYDYEAVSQTAQAVDPHQGIYVHQGSYQQPSADQRPQPSAPYDEGPVVPTIIRPGDVVEPPPYQA